MIKNLEEKIGFWQRTKVKYLGAVMLSFLLNCARTDYQEESSAQNPIQTAKTSSKAVSDGNQPEQEQVEEQYNFADFYQRAKALSEEHQTEMILQKMAVVIGQIEKRYDFAPEDDCYRRVYADGRLYTEGDDVLIVYKDNNCARIIKVTADDTATSTITNLFSGRKSSITYEAVLADQDNSGSGPKYPDGYPNELKNYPDELKNPFDK